MKRALILLTFLTLFPVACGPAPISNVQDTPFDSGLNSETWALIPAGEFLSGQHNHQTAVDYNYQIMLTDVTNTQYAAYLNEAIASGAVTMDGQQIAGNYPGDKFHGYEHEEEIAAGAYVHVPLNDPGLRLVFDGGSVTPQPGYENHPMVLVSWFGAKAYCEFYGWRLPTEIEWEKAARGTDGRAYPWGDEILRENANYYSSHDIFEKTFGKQGNTTPVGFYNGNTYLGYQTLDSSSPFGLYDMAGNVWQWTGDVYPDQHYRYMRGGSKDNYAYNLRVWTRNSAGPSFSSPALGFRCAKDY